ncbi:DUF1963 domain-containing protein [Actinoplanes sp. NPDC051851]|uniref:DUF1963 domain-containing protein n=1 Tax=Actinoplanes sp. NPDC051851 TaxID=3154753 RepID=UPI00341D5DE4
MSPPTEGRHASSERPTPSRHTAGDHQTPEHPTPHRHASADHAASHRHASPDHPTAARHDGSADRPTTTRHGSADQVSARRHVSEAGSVASLPAEVRALVRTRLPVEAATAYLEMSRPSIALERPARRAAVRATAGTIGGDPGTVPFDWPYYRSQPMLLLARLDCSHLAPLLGRHWPFPDHGWLLFFHDDGFTAPYFGDHGDDGCHVMHLPAGTGAPALATLPPLPLTATPLAALPDWQSGVDEELDIPPTDMINLWEDLSPYLTAPRHRLFGYPDTQATPPTGHVPLLQVSPEAGTQWGTVSGVTFWIPPTALSSSDFSTVRRSYELT